RKRQVRALLKPHEIDRAVSLREGELAALIFDDKEAKRGGVVEWRTAARGDKLVHTRVWRPGKEDDAMKRATDARIESADALRKFRGFTAFADDLADPEVSRDGDEAKATMTFTTDDLAKAIRGLLDASPVERRKLREALVAAHDATIVFSLVHTPYDALGLQLVTW
ncbi:MAG: hypothetical protein ACHREM_30055, partial [Polyangiales bacterium]